MAPQSGAELLPLGLPAAGAEGFPAGPLPFVTPSSFVYACGNALRFMSVDGEDEEQGIQEFAWGSGSGVTAVAASPKQGIVAYAERRKTIHPPKVYVMRLEGKQVVCQLSLDDELGVVWIDVARDTTRLCIVSDVPDHTIIVWDWEQNAVLARSSAKASRATCVSFNPSDHNVLCSSGARLELWELVASDAGDDDFLVADPVINIDQEDRDITAHCWGAGDTLFAGSDTGEVVQLNARTGRRSAGSLWLPVCDGSVTAMALTLKHVVVGGSDGQVCWVLISSSTVDLSSPWVHGQVCSLSFSPGYDCLVVGSTGGAIYQCDVPRDLIVGGPEWSNENQLELDLVGGFHDGAYVAMEAFKDIPVAVTAGARGVITVWKLPTLSPIASTVVSATASLTALALCPEARAVAVATDSGHVYVYDLSDLSTPRCVYRSRLHTSPVCGLAFVPHLIVSAGEDGTVAFVSVSEDNGLAPLGRAQLPALNSACLLAGGAGSVVAATSDGRLLRFGVPLASELAAAAAGGGPFSPPKVEEVMMGAPAMRIFASPDARTLIAVCADRSVKSFDLGASPPVLGVEWSGGSTRCRAVAFSQAWIALGFMDGSVAAVKASQLRPGDRPHVIFDHSRGGVGALCAGQGALEGWLFSAGGDGCLFAHVPSADAPRGGGQFAALLSGALSVLPEEEGGEGEEGELVWEVSEGKSGMGMAAGAVRGAEGRVMGDKFADIRDRLAAVLAENESRPEKERLERESICVDVGERDLLVRLADERVAAVRAATEVENEHKDELARRIRVECFDTMEAHEVTVMPFGAGGGISSYALPKVKEVEVERLEKVKALRRVEMRELQMAAAEGLKCAVDDIIMTPQEWAQVQQERGEIKQGGQRDSVSDENEAHSAGIAAALGAENGGENLLYSDMQLSKRENRVNQVELLREKVRRIRSNFNAQVKQLVKDKGAEMDRVEEKNVRLLEIIAELNVTEEVLRPSHAATEHEGWQLKVDDSEIKVPRYLSAADRAAAEKHKLEEEARTRESSKDNAIARALEGMMGGTLEVRKGEASAVDLEKPVFYDEEGLSDEQIKACRDYDKRLQVQEEEREKQRKALETEAKKIRTEIQVLLDAFDMHLAALADEKLGVDAKIYQIELQIALLLDSLVKEEDQAVHIARLQKLAENASDDLQNATAAVASFREELDAFREGYENVLNEDKAFDKSLRREFVEEAGTHFDTLSKLWRKRTYVAADESLQESEPVSLDPFVAAGAAEDSKLPRPELLVLQWPDGLEDFPPELDPEVVERFAVMRERKIDLEAEVKKMASKLLQLNQRLQELTQVQIDSQVQCEQARDELKRLVDEGVASEHDLVLLFKVKQGCVEIDLETLMDESSDAALVEVSSIKRLNTAVRGLGTEKVSTMREMKEFKSKIHATNWETECLDFRAGEVADNTRFYQLLWVTKDLQATIKGGDEGRKAAENATLEKQMAHSKKLHDIKVEDMKKRLFRGHKQIREKELENGKLDEYVQDLAVSVAQREKIIRVRESDKGEVDEEDYKMQEIVWRRLVLEEAKQQSEDIAILKAEVDRLRQRTFPSFAKSYAARNGL